MFGVAESVFDRSLASRIFRRAVASFTAASAILIGFKLFKLAATAVKPVAYCVTWLDSLVICLCKFAVSLIVFKIEYVQLGWGAVNAVELVILLFNITEFAPGPMLGMGGLVVFAVQKL